MTAFACRRVWQQLHLIVMQIHDIVIGLKQELWFAAAEHVQIFGIVTDKQAQLKKL